MATSNEPILFLSGAGLPSWVWDEMRAELAPTATVVAARPPADTSKGGRQAGLTDYVAAALDSAPAERFAVVGHSSGALVGSELARTAPERVTALLAVSGVVPAPGGSFLSSMPLPNRLILKVMMRVVGTRPPDAVIRRGLGDDVPSEVADRICADFEPESMGLYQDSVSQRPLPRRSGYVVTTRDPQLSADLQRRFAANLGAQWQGQLPTGHLCMVEEPETLAVTIRSFLAETPPEEAAG